IAGSRCRQRPPPDAGARRTLRIRLRGKIERRPGPVRLVGLSTTNMDMANPRCATARAITRSILVSTPIRWGNASSLYYRMIERMNCVQNQVTIANRVLMRNKVASFIITGGQDNVQAVAGQMLGFF